MRQRSLDVAKMQKNDEFYTQLADIENELKHYKDQFYGKVVFCSCDDPYESNFFKFFANNFNHWGLKKLIATSYVPSPIAGTQLPLLEIEGLKPDGRQPFKIEINEVPDTNGDGAIDLADVRYLLTHNANVATPLEGNGDFRSLESLRLLEEADIVCTNPPFSLFREFVAQLVEHNKKFLIIGNNNALTYKEIFKLIKENKIWQGYGVNKTLEFVLSDAYKKWDRIENGKKIGKVPAISWFTNLDVAKRHEELVMYKKYIPEEYPTYENYEAINIDAVAKIPMDYDGVMGVPITFLDKYNPDQFEIIGLGISNSGIAIGVRPYKPEHKKYRKEIQQRGAVDGDLYMMVNGIVEVPYARVVIKNKKAKHT